MVKSSDKILSIMQKTACSEDIFFDLPAYVALLRSFDFWRIYDFYKIDRKAYLFSQIIMNPKFFSETDKVIADALFICEKSVQNYRREFKEVFSDEYEYAKTLDTDTLLAIRSILLILLGIDGFRSFIRNDLPDCLSSRVLRFFSDSDLRQAK